MTEEIKKPFNSKKLMSYLDIALRIPEACYTSNIAEKYGYSKSTVKKYLQTLENINFVTSKKEGRSKVYYLNTENRLNILHCLVKRNPLWASSIEKELPHLKKKMSEEQKTEFDKKKEERWKKVQKMVENNKVFQYLLFSEFEGQLKIACQVANAGPEDDWKLESGKNFDELAEEVGRRAGISFLHEVQMHLTEKYSREKIYSIRPGFFREINSTEKLLEPEVEEVYRFFYMIYNTKIGSLDLKKVIGENSLISEWESTEDVFRHAEKESLIGNMMDRQMIEKESDIDVEEIEEKAEKILEKRPDFE